jgi:uracil-DNA glycosylase family 4
MAGTFTGSIEQFKCQMASCVACDLAKYRKQTVFGDGVLNPTAMIIGEAPGEDEDAQGIPFVGKAGQQLTKMLTYAGLDRTKNAYIANTVLCRPPNNRTPLMEEMDACRERLFNQIDMVATKFIVLLGRSAWSTIFQQ